MFMRTRLIIAAAAIFGVLAVCIGCASPPAAGPPGATDQSLLERTRIQLQWANEQLENYRLALFNAMAQSTDPAVIAKLDALAQKVEKAQAVAQTAGSVIVPPAQPGAPPTIDWGQLTSIGGLLPFPGNVIALAVTTVIGGIARKQQLNARTASATTTVAAGRLDQVLSGVSDIVESIDAIKDTDPELWAKLKPVFTELHGPEAQALVDYTKGRKGIPNLDELRKLAA